MPEVEMLMGPGGAFSEPWRVSYSVGRPGMGPGASD